MNVPKGQTGNSSRGPGDGGNKDHWKESDRKDGKKDQDSRSAPEPKKPEENPASVSVEGCSQFFILRKILSILNFLPLDFFPFGIQSVWK